MQTINLHKLHFGSDDAELDEKKGFLDKVFLKTSIYHRVKESNRELVIGRKGSGKSAIWLMLRKALLEEKHSVITITPQSLSQQKIEKLRVDSINQNESYVLSWKYALLVKLSLELVKSAAGNNKQIEWVRKFLRDNEEIEKGTFEKLKGSFGISELKLSAFGMEGSIKTSVNSTQKDLADSIERFQSILEQILINSLSTHFYILIDRVDEIWQQTEQSKIMIVGLIKAVHDLNIALPRTQFILFLREDIYDNLIFNDSDKFHSLEERLVWEEKDLKHLIATRGKVSASLDLQDIDDLWDNIFVSTVRNQPSFQYIVARTLRRPRDIIQFCNNALAEAQNNGHHRILAQDILKAEGQYSAWKLKDIVSEFIVQYPFLDDILVLFQGFNAEFTRAEFESRYQDTINKLKNHEGIQSVTANRMLQILFSIGFLGARTNGITVFAFDDPSVVLAQQEKIVVHPVFHSALSVQRPPDNGKLEFDQRGQVVSNQYNVAGDVAIGGNVATVYYESDVSMKNELRHLHDLLNVHERNKEQLLTQKATYGIDVPSNILNQLEDTDERILDLKERISLLEKKIGNK